jgi:site-specific DNA-cytosine methylase
MYPSSSILFDLTMSLTSHSRRTAYGSWEAIPGGLDILVAGTACVDFSPLNNLQKSLQQGGESAATFDGLLQYAEKYRPRMVIQENVRNAPWNQMKGKWEELGYMSVQANVDTKHYYIPQTRERGYMVVIDKRRLEVAGLLGGLMDLRGIQHVTQRVSELIVQFKRAASAPVGLFLLDDEDRRLELIEMRARLDSRSEISWEQYKSRHIRHREDLALGTERPITRSLPGVNDLQAPDFYWHRFWQTQPERVWDTVDMNFLKRMLQEYDMNFKE